MTIKEIRKWREESTAKEAAVTFISRIDRLLEIAEAAEAAIRDYHFALDCREHGGVAQDKAIKETKSALHLPWRPGEELELRKAL